MEKEELIELIEDLLDSGASLIEAHDNYDADPQALTAQKILLTSSSFIDKFDDFAPYLVLWLDELREDD